MSTVADCRWHLPRRLATTPITTPQWGGRGPGVLTAVIDIGKTNKKVVIYDRQLNTVAIEQTEYAAAPGPDGVLHEPVAPMWAWFKRTLSALYRRHPFHAIAITTHGATQVCLDADGNLALPVIAYDHGLDAAEQAALDRRFLALAGGDAEALQAVTGTCDLPLLINPAKWLLFARGAYPQGVARTTHVVNYPQYWGHLLTGRLAAEPTYAFNHSYLYDYQTRRPSKVAAAVGFAAQIPTSFRRPWDQLGRVTPRLQVELGLPPLPVTVGIHDSNAALLPYLVAYPERDFVLNTTGTWCVAMHQVPAYGYQPGELGRKVIFNIDALGGYQKVSFLMGGQEYGCYHDLIGGDHGGFDAAAADAALAEANNRILPGAFPSQFPAMSGGATDAERSYSLAELQAGERPAWFADQARAHILLNASLALQTVVALRHTGLGPETAVFIEGGFRQNPTYLHLLAALLPGQPVACTSFDQATSAGAALLGHALLDGSDPRAVGGEIAIEETPIAVTDIPNLAAYADAFYAHVRPQA